MDLKQLFTDDDAVSPVIGVILMVAITVILAAVIGAFVLDLGSGTDSAPSVTWDYSYDSGASEVTITHNGGDQISSAPDKLSVSGSSVTLTGIPTDLSAGKSMTVTGVGAGEKISIVWSSPESDQSSIIGEYTAPS